MSTFSFIPGRDLGLLLVVGLWLGGCRNNAPQAAEQVIAGNGTQAAPAADPTAVNTGPQAAQCGSIQKLSLYQGIYLAGQPGPEDFQLLKQQGVLTVIDLRRPQEQRGFDEAALTKALGLHYESLPFSNETDLTDEVFAKGRELLNSSPRPLLLHCGSANRVGAIWLAWRALDGGLTLPAATAEAKAVGLKAPALEAQAIDYVQRKR